MSNSMYSLCSHKRVIYKSGRLESAGAEPESAKVRKCRAESRDEEEQAQLEAKRRQVVRGTCTLILFKIMWKIFF